VNYHDFLKFCGFRNFEGVEVNFPDFLKFCGFRNFEDEANFQGLANMHGVLNVYGPEDDRGYVMFMDVLVQVRGTGVAPGPSGRAGVSIRPPLLHAHVGYEECHGQLE
jgi:hypothetical protein